jgi:surfactin synthase thioesterase subunit
VFPGGHFFIIDQSTEVMGVLKQHFRAGGVRTAG